MRLLTRTDLQTALSMREIIDITRQAFVALSTGGAQVPLRLALPSGEANGVTLLMPALLPEALTVKIVSVHPQNRTGRLPLIHALVILLDPATGLPLAALEGGMLTALRTGAASGVATALLARPDAEVLAVFGAGVQARTQILAVAAIRPIKRCRIYAHHPDAVRTLLTELQPQLPGVEFQAAASPTEAVTGADVICTATTSSTPVFSGLEVPPGTHINAVGSFTPEAQEIDFATLQRAGKIVVDERAAALSEAGELIQALAAGVLDISDLYGEIGEIAAGLKPGRENEQEITFFKSVGNAVQDAALARALYERAREQQRGVEFDFFS